MEGYKSFQGAKITKELVQKLKSDFKWSIFCAGIAKTHVTPSGGVHYSGQLKLFPALTFEIRRANAYIMVTLMEYPKGVILHVHVFFPDIKKRGDWSDVVDYVYNEVGEYIRKYGMTKSDSEG